MGNNEKILIVIAARGGSKGVKNKNTRKLNGKPLIAYTIEVARKWGVATRIVCSTDSEEIARIAKDYGIDVPFIRSPELASDNAGKVPVIRDAWERCQKIFDEKYSIVVDLDVTSPVRSVHDLDKCLALYAKRKPEILYSVVEARKNPYFNMVEESEDGYFRLCKEMPQNITRRQDVPTVYDMNASIYFYSREFLDDSRKSTVTGSKRAVAYIMGGLSSLDIDTELDLKYIEFLIREGVIRL